MRLPGAAATQRDPESWHRRDGSCRAESSEAGHDATAPRGEGKDRAAGEKPLRRERKPAWHEAAEARRVFSMTAGK